MSEDVDDSWAGRYDEEDECQRALNMLTIFPQILATQTSVEPWIRSAWDLFQPQVSSDEGKGNVATRCFNPCSR